MENKFNNKGSVNIGKQIYNTNNQGQINISNDNSTINATQNMDNRLLNNIDINKLIEELNNLKIILAEKEMYEEAGAIKDAIEAKEYNRRISFLKKAGIKALEISQEISLPVATSVLGKILGVDV
ncbi:MAG: hypothetical protein ABF289_19900 [Clostridiales bacterium]